MDNTSISCSRSESHLDDDQEQLLNQERTTNSWSKPDLVRRNVFSQQPAKALWTTRLPRFVVDHPTAVYAAVPLLCAFLWIAMMVDFLTYYLTLPRHNGRLPQLSYTYASFPYISCVGEVRLGHFQGFCVAVCVCTWFTYILELTLMASIPTGRPWRWAKAILAWIGSFFLIMLSFYSVVHNDQLHLKFTSVHVVATGLARVCDGMLQQSLLKFAPESPYIRRPYVLKTTSAWLVAPASWIAIAGFWGCRNPLTILDPKATCYKVVLAAAPAEWLLSVAWAFYLMLVAMDLYYVDHVKADLIPLLKARRHDIELRPYEKVKITSTGYRPLSDMSDGGSWRSSTRPRSTLAAAWFRQN